MTKREQERCDAALSYLKDSKLDLPQVVKASSYFIAGAKWSDKKVINKVCEWIEDNVENVFVRVNGTMTELNGVALSKYLRTTMEE